MTWMFISIYLRTTANPKALTRLEKRLALSLEYVDELLAERLEYIDTIKEAKFAMEESLTGCRKIVETIFNASDVLDDFSNLEVVAVLEKYAELLNKTKP
jgi:hypothetical protein